MEFKFVQSNLSKPYAAHEKTWFTKAQRRNKAHENVLEINLSRKVIFQCFHVHVQLSHGV